MVRLSERALAALRMLVSLVTPTNGCSPGFSHGSPKGRVIPLSRAVGEDKAGEISADR